MTDSPYISDVTEAHFDSEVITRSRQVPVLVDFWAAWCGPCKSLMPLLAKLAEEYQGRFFLAKVNSDEQQALAARFGVRNLPTVKLFKDGVEVAEFVGAQPEKTIRALLNQHIANPSDNLLQSALDQEAAGQTDQALMRLRELHASEPANDRVTIHLGRLLLEQGLADEGERILAAIPAGAQNDPSLAPLLAHLEFVRIAAAAPPLSTLEHTVATHPDDMQARLGLGARYLLKGYYAPALEQWLTIVQTDRKFGDDAGRRALLSAFALLGSKDELVRQYRQLLATALH
ncbi:MAG TPA: thioredoxin [Acidiferrobacter sp.]|nr:thioredoxin [Acidiferrobacter sp.]